MVILIIGIAVIICTIGVYGWIVGGNDNGTVTMKMQLDKCHENGGYDWNVKGETYRRVICSKLRGLIAVYVFLIVAMIIANIIALKRFAAR